MHEYDAQVRQRHQPRRVVLSRRDKRSTGYSVSWKLTISKDAGEKSGTILEARAFLEMGFAVLMVDFRGSGESSESYTTVGFLEAEDVAVSVAYAREELHQAKVILYGQSMGAA